MDFLQATMGYHFSRAEEVRMLVSNPLEKSPTSKMSAKAMETLEQVRCSVSFPTSPPILTNSTVGLEKMLTRCRLSSISGRPAPSIMETSSMRPLWHTRRVSIR